MAETITTPEQMREAAIAACKKVADEAKSYGIPQMTMGANTCYDAIRAIPIATQPVAVTVKPTDAQINSACLSYRHDFGLMNKRDQDDLRFTANEWLIAWQKEARILSALIIQPSDPLSDPRVVALVEVLALAQYGLSWASAYFRDSNHPYNDDPCPPVKRGLDAIRAALRAIGGES